MLQNRSLGCVVVQSSFRFGAAGRVSPPPLLCNTWYVATAAAAAAAAAGSRRDKRDQHPEGEPRIVCNMND